MSKSTAVYTTIVMMVFSRPLFLAIIIGVTAFRMESEPMLSISDVSISDDRAIFLDVTARTGAGNKLHKELELGKGFFRPAEFLEEKREMPCSLKPREVIPKMVPETAVDTVVVPKIAPEMFAEEKGPKTGNFEIQIWGEDQMRETPKYTISAPKSEFSNPNVGPNLFFVKPCVAGPYDKKNKIKKNERIICLPLEEIHELYVTAASIRSVRLCPTWCVCCGYCLSFFCTCQACTHWEMLLKVVEFSDQGVIGEPTTKISTSVFFGDVGWRPRETESRRSLLL